MLGTMYIDKENLGNGYVYYGETFDIHGPESGIPPRKYAPILDIPSKIIRYSYDDTYIIASQDYTKGSPRDMYEIGEYQHVRFRPIDTDEDNIVY